MYTEEGLKEQLKPIGKLKLMSMKTDVESLFREISDKEKIVASCVGTKTLTEYIVVLTDKRLLITKMEKHSSVNVPSYNLDEISGLYASENIASLSIIFTYRGQEEKINIISNRNSKQFIQVLKDTVGSQFEASTSINEAVSLNSPQLDYMKKNVLHDQEKVIAVLHAGYEKRKYETMNGYLVATDQRLLFVHFKNNNHFQEEWDYAKLNGVQTNWKKLVNYLLITVGRTVKEFSINGVGKNKDKFIAVLREYMKNPPSKKKEEKNNIPDKYKQLEQLANLKEQGILTEEEFNTEKQKILNQESVS